MPLSPEQIDQYKEDGYLIVHDLIPVETFEPLIHEFEDAIDAKAAELHQAGVISELWPEETFEYRLARLSEQMDDPDELWKVGQSKHQKTAGTGCLDSLSVAGGTRKK